MVYGEETETTSAFVYHYQLPESFLRSQPLSALGLDIPQAVRIIAHDSLASTLVAKLRPPPPAPTPLPPPPSTSSFPNPRTTAAAEVAQVRVAPQAPAMTIFIALPPPPPPPAPIPTPLVASTSTSPAPSTATATTSTISGDLPVPIKIEASAEAAAVVVSSAPEMIPLANLPVSRTTSSPSSSPSSTQSSPSSLQRQLAELKSQLKSQITEKHQLEEELKRVVNLFRDEETHLGRWCCACFSGPPDFLTSECCQRGTYYCCLACQHRDWRRHMPRTDRFGSAACWSPLSSHAADCSSPSVRS